MFDLWSEEWKEEPLGSVDLRVTTPGAVGATA